MYVAPRPTPYQASRLFVAALLGIASAAEGRAFFFAPLPLTSTTTVPSLIPVEQKEIVNRDWMPPPPDTPLPPEEFPPDGHAPEPATGLAALIGLGLVGLARRRK